jgi:division protein CdvB (Snf7/Vps24/ESCRT-III family)
MKIHSVVIRTEANMMVEIQVWGDKISDTAYANEGQAIQAIAPTLKEAFAVLDNTTEYLGLGKMSDAVKQYFKENNLGLTEGSEVPQLKEKKNEKSNDENKS